VLYTPIEVDYNHIKEIRDQQKKEIFDDLDSNIVRYYQARIGDLEAGAVALEDKVAQLELAIRQKDEEL